jgi:DNA primase (bacterial type)
MKQRTFRNVEDLLLRLKGVRRVEKGWMALCPAHDDHNPSLSIKEGEDGRVLFHCFADCSSERVCGVLGIGLGELGPKKDSHNSSFRQTTSRSRRLVATYDYTDENGKLLFQVLRYEPKQFCQRRPDGKGGWLYNLNNTRRVLYRLPDLLKADTSEMVFIVEGEKDAERLVALGLVGTTNPGGAGKWRSEYVQGLRDLHVCVLPDSDKPGSRHAQDIANSLASEAASVRILSLPNLPEKGDVSNWLDTGGTAEALKSLAVSTPIHEHEDSQAETPQAESDETVLERLASLPVLDYERERETAAKTLGCRTAVLDKLVQSERSRIQPVHGGLQGHALELDEIEPWPESLNGAEILKQISEVFSDYIVLPDGAADALALWCAHAHVFDGFICSPRLNISSPDKQCGKTTLRDVLAVFVPRPLPTENLTAAVLFRVVESHKPTLLADECDAWLRDNEELRGLLNAGHGRTGQALRCEGEGNEIRAFRVFSPAVLCGIGSLPGTLYDRSIVIRLARAKPGEVRKRFDSRRTQTEQELCRKLSRFCADNRTLLQTADPELPAGLFNRLADNWRPLFAVAEIAGGDWPSRAASAFARLSSKDDVDAQGIGVMLLTDIQKVFQDLPSHRIFSRDLVTGLCAMTDRPWLEAHRGRSITETWLARRLRYFEVRSKDLRIGTDRAKGYEVTDFVDAFERYVFPQEHSSRDSVTSPVNTEQNDTPTRDNLNVCRGTKPHESTENIGLSRCHALDTPETVELLVVGEI